MSARKLWDAVLAEYQIDTAPGLALLTSALRSFDLAELARAEHPTTGEILARARCRNAPAVLRDGLTIKGKRGTARAHPAAAIFRDNRAAFVQTMRVLGFPDHGGE